jgi:RNA polymerase sigma-70 factor (ECF subfamily)
MTDGELVRQARAGHSGALAELTHRWAGKVLALCHVQVGRAEVAPDLAQESLLRAMKGLSTLAQPEKFGPWVRGIAKRVCLDWLKSKRRAAIPFSTLALNRDLENHVASRSERPVCEQNEDDEDLHQAIAELPEDCREALLLYYFQDVTYQELADSLEVSAATINARLTRARSLLRRRLVIGQESLP